MKLIQEANLDDQFSSAMQRLQQAVQDLEKITKDFGDEHRPVSSQISQLQNAADVLTDLRSEMNIKRLKK